jgi:malate/lactate dehydrogenase
MLAQHNLSQEVTLLDVREGAAAGAALDIRESAPYHGFDTLVTGSHDPAVGNRPGYRHSRVTAQTGYVTR